MNYYVYTHSDLSGNVFYVGKGTKRRAWDKNRGEEWFQKSKEGYNINIDYTELTQDEALDLEALLIETYGIDNLVNKKKETPKQSRGTLYYDLMQKVKDYKALMEIHDNFDYYWKIPYFKKHIQLIHYLYQLKDEYKL